MESRERGFFGKLLVFIFSLLAFGGLVAMALSVLNAYVDPNRFIWTTFFGLAFWEILFYNILMLIILLSLKSRKAWIAVLALMIAIPGFSKSYSRGKKMEADSSIRIMSYNVHNFGHVDGKTDKKSFAYQVMNTVRDQAPDILCCQEFFGFIPKVTRQACIDSFAVGAGFPYVYYNRKSNYGGNVIFSKYPIKKVSEVSIIAEEHTYGIMVSVDAGEKGKFHVANVHLLSYMITDDEIESLTTPQERQQYEALGKTLVHKLNFAFQRRSEELQQVLKGLSPIEGPVIVCGDFNEPPLSYNYRQMQKAGFVDTFTKVGHGIKPTYAGKLPLLRIDYIWANDGVTPLNFKRHRWKASDHYPIMLDFAINE
jgi:endonuclease/exonuclease/phosphatase family metal-dependent hydrolase